jgi:uncharacterized protein
LLVLLPPSETKRPGGVGVSIDKLAIIWAALDPARDEIFSKLDTLLQSREESIRGLKLGKKPDHALEVMKNLQTSPTMPAIERYSGVLFEAFDYQSLGLEARKRVEQQLFIQSALFGLLPATEMIPDYKFSSSAKLAGLSLTKLWNQAHEAVWPRMIGPILDMRSESYRTLAPIPPRESYFVEVLDAKSGRALNHFNKKAKGAFARKAMELGIESVSDVPEIAKAAGFKAKLDGYHVLFIIPPGF